MLTAKVCQALSELAREGQHLAAEWRRFSFTLYIVDLDMQLFSEVACPSIRPIVDGSLRPEGD